MSHGAQKHSQQVGLSELVLPCIAWVCLSEAKTPFHEGRVMEIGAFGIAPISMIADLADLSILATLESLRSWTRPGNKTAHMRDFVKIRERAMNDWLKRYHWWHIPAIIVAVIQGVIFGIAIEPLFKAGGVPRFLFHCAEQNWTGLYLLVSAAANAVFRLLMWHASDHEVVSVYALSDSAKLTLQDIVDSDPTASTNTTATTLPPLYYPLMSKIVWTLSNFWAKLRKRQPSPPKHPQGAVVTPLKDQIEYAKAIFRRPSEILHSGFKTTDAAPRWHPLIILVHLSTMGRPQLKMLFTGFVEAALLLILTFFFAAQWGGNLFITAWALGLLFIFITVGCALALVYVWLSAQVWGLHVINCDERTKIVGCLRILCSMEEELVEANGAHSFNGHRLDYLQSFKRWRLDYVSGRHDQNHAPSSASAPKESQEKDNVAIEVDVTPVDNSADAPVAQPEVATVDRIV
ncbi:hypothetical protein P152DRAFT_182987 [Eremomyces bilateralis CBS 781.70]|uniref:Uncharacterized protein n=1 Tax=Eremomyces bilateralis CBS 781.70 TaxID=1392243 RepID=A0A6G1GBS7_9PEZI|nr:uncharacterized protein P152DRAFT_182987 [Eremomyces bilateralis CBS 781.70]KAF1815351.1 hypothetical protein P152DRAFT_182987 [Eremomyces bilateralis CBS 781.70]